MKILNNLSIGKKLQVINMIIISTVTLITTLILSAFLYGSLQEEYEYNARTIVDMLTESASSAVIFRDAKVAGEILANLSKVSNIVHAEIYESGGQLFAGYAREGSNYQAPVKFDFAQNKQGFQFGSMELNLAQPMAGNMMGEGQIGLISLQMDLRPAYRKFAYQVAMLLMTGGLSFFLSAGILSRMQRGITLPLEELTTAMRRVEKDGDFTVHAKISSGDEIGELSGVFNRMVNELSRRESDLNTELKERRKVEATLNRLANFDGVTNLPNRHSFNLHIEHAILNSKYEHERFALFFIDLDNFKFVNDTFGHQAGDELLHEVALRLRNSLRAEDFLARLGGDEFVVLIFNFTDLNQINIVAEKMINVLKPAFDVDDKEAFVGASVGISLCPDNGMDSESLQKQADSAMYQAKRMGKNNFQYYQAELLQEQERRLKLEAQLRRSLERGEIVPFYQPIVFLSTQRIAGFETLVRWITQEGKVISPDHFIPLAEEIGLIVEIGRFVMEAAAVQTAEWHRHYGPLFVAVNFSSRQFKLLHLAQDVIEVLKTSGLPHDSFEVEITESVLMDDTRDSMETLQRLSEQGISIAIDDFGTGYSSLSYQTSFPVNKLKIDRSFVSKLPADKNAMAVVTAILGIAHSLGMKVVAEGIETQEQLDCLVGLGCEYGQGYYFSKPVPAAKATELLQQAGSAS